MDEKISLRETTQNDSSMIKELVDKYWGGEPLIIRGKKYYPSSLDGIIALKEKEIIGFFIMSLEFL